MLFNSIQYLLFLPVVVLLYFMLAHKYRWILLLLASYFFYACWRVDFLILILVSTLIDYWAGIKMDKFSLSKDKKIYLYISLAGNLGMLFSFKYLGFCNEIIRDIVSLVGTSYPIERFDILLPVGISFYTFQTLSYTIDIYKGKRKAEPHLGKFAVYVSFFPQLVAGPIERSTSLLPQFSETKNFSWNNISAGTRLIVWGMFKKIIIADQIWPFIAPIFSHPENYSGSIYIYALFSFIIYIYADFSAYTDIAIGSARLMGFKLTRNFNKPNLARNISEFWQRWHITLTDWIHDYVFIPLVRLSKNSFQTNLSLIILFLLVGLWHGASWNFVLFGLLHATYIIIFRNSKKLRKKLIQKTGYYKIPRIKEFFDIIITFLLWVFSGLFFAGKSVKTSIYMLTHLFSEQGEFITLSDMGLYNSQLLYVAGLGTFVLYWMDIINKKELENPIDNIKTVWFRWSIYHFMIFMMICFNHGETNDFHYFQF